MTHTLRRRLQEADDSTLSQLTESFCMVGTPLPPLDSTKKDPNEYKPIWQQEARDEQGRRRFHGAFTGGFSAGYFNTVGSKEGWIPSSFKSSRSDKAKGEKKQSRPEDFMDEEDLADMKESRQLQTASTFAEPERGRDPLAGGENEVGSLAAAALEDLIRPASTSLGVKLLKRMGWKEGHGIGPRISTERRERLLVLQGAKRPALQDDHVPDEMKKLKFPPPDTKLIEMEANSDRRGLGHTGAASLDQLLKQVRSQAEPSRPSQGSGTPLPGIRSTTDAGSDDEEADIYAGYTDIRDSTLVSRPCPVNHGGEDKLLLSSEPIADKENTWHDGRPMLPGFQIASRKLPAEPWFAPPPVPKGWKPNPQAFWAEFEPQGKQEANGQRQALDAATRGSLLGEVKIPGPPPALADFLSVKARERLEASSHLPKQEAAAPLPRATIEIPKTDPRTAHAALHGFMPFGNDLSKQERYRAYLTSQAEDNELDIAPIGQTVDQLNHELREFAKSAAIFRPMSTAMASRFTSASSVVAAHEVAAPAPGLWQPPPKPAVSKPVPEADKVKEQLTPAQQAARNGMFGTMTRTSEGWHPARLLCKRFNVPDSYPDRAGEADPVAPKRNDMEDLDPFYGASKQAPKIKVDQHWEKSKRQLQHLAETRAWESAVPQNTDETSVKAVPKDAFEDLGLGEDERQGQDMLTYVKPPIDIFKAIFASDEESDGEEVPAPEPAQAKGNPTTAFRPAFVPRSKRKGEDTASTPTETEKRRKKSKTKTKGMLTFDLDEGEDVSFTVPKKEKVKPARPKASDLFK